MIHRNEHQNKHKFALISKIRTLLDVILIYIYIYIYINQELKIKKSSTYIIKKPSEITFTVKISQMTYPCCSWIWLNEHTIDFANEILL